jgi:predicted Zn-dependent protease
MLAAVLAHEVGHVAAKHGLKSIKKSRLVDAFKLIGQEAMDRYGPEQLAQLTGIFEGVLGDIMEKLVERGYDRQYEYEADHLSVIFSARTGYSPVGLLDFLQTLTGQAGGASAKGWFRTHPNAEDRLRNSKAEVAGLKKMPVKEAVRTGRFQAGVKGLK